MKSKTDSVLFYGLPSVREGSFFHEECFDSHGWKKWENAYFALCFDGKQDIMVFTITDSTNIAKGRHLTQ